MKKVILVRYSEIALKKGKRSWFEKLLIENIKCALGNNILSITTTPGRIILEVRNIERAVDSLKRVFGIKSFSVSYMFEFSTLDDITRNVENLAKTWVNNKKFKVECRRVGKHPFTSYDVKVRVGDILSRYGTVDVKNPEVVVNIEIRNNKAYLYKDSIYGPGGLPTGSEVRVLSLISGGFDSAVAAWFAMKRGARVDFLYCDIGSKEDLINVLKIIEILSKWQCTYKSNIYIVDCNEILLEFERKIKPELALIVFRRLLYKLAEKISSNIRYLGIITGESIGQKSSQTLENLYSASYGINPPIYRPLIGFDKDEIVKIARDIGTYDISEKVGEPCSLLSISPKSKSSPDEILKEFEKIQDYLDKLDIKMLNISDLNNYINSLLSSINKNNIPGRYDVILSINLDLPYKNYIKVSNIEEAIKIIKNLGKDKRYLVVCKRGTSSRIVKEILEEEGYHVFSLDEKALKNITRKEPP